MTLGRRLSSFLFVLLALSTATCDSEKTARLERENAELKEVIELMKLQPESVPPSSDADRKIAMDALAQLGLVGSNAERRSGWEVSVKVDPITSKNSYFLSVPSVDRPQSRLFLRCDERRSFDMFVAETSYMGMDGGNVAVKIDDRPPQTWWGSPGSGGDSVFFSNRKNATALLGAKQLIVQYSPYGKTKESATFDVSGLDVAAADFRKGCPF